VDGASERSKMTGLMLIDSSILSGKPASGQSFLPGPSAQPVFQAGHGPPEFLRFVSWHSKSHDAAL
jgi:hypothetical protein